MAEKIQYSIEVAIKHTAPASACSECGQCEAACPQHIAIIENWRRPPKRFE